jgi:WD40 repeat protein
LDLDNSNVVRTFKPPIFQPSSVAVSADGTTILASDALQPMAGSWTVADGEPRDIYAEQWLGSSGYVTLARNGTHRGWWHSQTGEAQDLAASARPEIEPRPGGQAQLSPDGRILLTYYGGVEGLNNIHSYRLWDIESGRLLSRRSGITLPIGHGGRYYSRCQSLAFSADSRLLAVGRRDGRIEVREIDGGRLVREWKVPVGSCDLVTFHPDGKRLVTWGDSMIRLWEIESGANVRTFEVPILHRMATTPDGRWLVVGSGRPRGL